jgi:hypothetical protein
MSSLSSGQKPAAFSSSPDTRPAPIRVGLKSPARLCPTQAGLARSRLPVPARLTRLDPWTRSDSTDPVGHRSHTGGAGIPLPSPPHPFPLRPPTPPFPSLSSSGGARGGPGGTERPVPPDHSAEDSLLASSSLLDRPGPDRPSQRLRRVVRWGSLQFRCEGCARCRAALAAAQQARSSACSSAACSRMESLAACKRPARPAATRSSRGNARAQRGGGWGGYARKRPGSVYAYTRSTPASPSIARAVALRQARHGCRQTPSP